jgi:N-acetylmuramoyl-L-alanine amidase
MRFKQRGFVHAIIPGHGGVDEKGIYHIAKKGSKQAEVDGKMIYEGEHNRYIVAEALAQSVPMGVKTINLVPDLEDISLSDRVQRINEAYDLWASKGYRLLLWEFHLNAFNGNVQGTEIYTSRGDNFSDKMASIWWEEMKEVVPDYKTRPDYGDGDPDKEMNFYVIKKSKAFGVLIEFFFFDNAKDVQRFCNPDGYHLWANTVVRSMSRIDTTIDANKLVLI